MRIRIVFSLKNRGEEVSFHHQYILAQIFKGVLVSGGDEKHIDYTHYNFSGLKGQTKVSRKGLHFYSSKVTVVFSCLSKEFLDYFLHHLFTFEEIVVGNLKLVPESVEEDATASIEDKMKYICISPIVLKAPQFQSNIAKEFIHPDMDEFSDLLYDSTMERMEESKLYTSSEISEFYKFQILPDPNYLTKLAKEKKKFARIYPVYHNDVKYEVRGYTFPFTLFAAKEVQEFLFNSGIGYLANKGFGMVDLALDKHIKQERKVKSYELKDE